MLCLYAFVNASFADPKLPKKYGTAHDIEGALIAQKFESICGQKKYMKGVVRSGKDFGDETMSWLGTV